MNQQITDKIKELVSIPSTADNLEALKNAVDLIADMLRSNQNITVEHFESNGKPSFLAYYGQKRPERFDIIFNGHVDVVPGKSEQFKPKQDGDKLYGRGAYDMKAACVAITEVFLKYAQDSPYKVGLQIVSDEEVGGYDGVKYQLDQGVAADFIIAGEMTNTDICTETRGICWVEVLFSGVAAHSGYAWEGDNSVAKAADFVNKVLAYYPLPSVQQWTTTASISAISTGNETFNRVPDNATVKIDFRFVPEDPNFESQESIISFLKGLAPEISEVKFEATGPAVKVTHGNPLLGKLEKAFESTIGTKAKHIKRYASSDARHFALAGQDCIEFGPAGNHHHGDEEYVLLSSLKPFQKTLIEFISK